jgi:hypothetical protein
MAFEHLEPWGFKPAQIRAGQICAITANVNRKKGSKAFAADDFMRIEPRGDGMHRDVESAQSIHAKAMVITEVYRAMEASHGNNR